MANGWDRMGFGIGELVELSKVTEDQLEGSIGERTMRAVSRKERVSTDDQSGVQSCLCVSCGYGWMHLISH